MIDNVHVLLTAIVLICAVLRYFAWRRNPGDRAIRAVFFALLFMEISFLLGHPGTYWFLHGLTGEIPSFLHLVQKLATMAMVFCASVFVLNVVAPDESVRWRASVLAVSAVVVVGCYLLGPFRLGMPILGSRGHSDPGVVAYVSAWQLYCAFAYVDLLRLGWSNRTPERDLLRKSLALLAIGCVLQLVHAAHKLYYLWAVWLGFPPSWVENGPSGVQMYIIFPAGICLLAGLVLPSIGAWLTRRRLHRELEPLASAVGVPDLGVRGLRGRLLSRVIGIRDALVGPLHSRLDSAVYDATLADALGEGLSAEDARARAEAACILAALRGDEPSGSSPRFFAPTADAEAAWLAKVSSAYAALTRADRAGPAPDAAAAGRPRRSPPPETGSAHADGRTR